MIKAILFDRDGVLVNSEIVNIRSSVRVLSEMGIEADTEDEAVIMGKHPLDYVDFFVEKYGIARNNFLDIRLNTYKNMLSDAAVFDDAVEFLEKIRKEGYLTGLVTSASRETTEYTISAFHFEDSFDAIVTFDDVSRRKPSPDPYLLAAKKLKTNPSECLVIEDSILGLAAAKNAGMRCVVRLNESTEGLDFSDADLVVKDVGDVWDYLLTLKKPSV